ncbi:MAG: autotransporter domain-containing protein, partial [Plesiomonas sp.]
LNKEGIVDVNTPESGISNVLGLSSNGNIALGFTTPNSNQSKDAIATVWDSKKGLIYLPKTDDYTDLSEATSISADTKYIVGFLGQINSGAHNNRAVYWDESNQVHLLDNLSGSSSAAYAISADGKVIVGEATTKENRDNAVYWNRDDGKIHSINQLGDDSKAINTNSDGSTIVGYTNIIGNSSKQNAFKWTQATGMVELKTPTNYGDYGSAATAVSDTGRIAGSVNVEKTSDPSDPLSHAAYWDSDGSFHDLGTLRTDHSGYSVSKSISRLGTVISGSSDADDFNGQKQRYGFIWKEGVGMGSVNQWLESANVNAGAMVAMSVNAMSSDGSTIAGSLSNLHGYVARILSIKEPTSPLEPKPGQPKPEQPKPEQPKPEQPKPEQPKPEQPKPEQPKPEQPKPEQPKPEQPKPEQPNQSGIVDVNQVKDSLVYVQHSLELQRQAVQNAAENADCAAFGPDGICLKVNSSIRNRNDRVGEYTNPAATITIAKQIKEHGRAGLSVTELHSHIKNDIGTKIEQTAPIFTAFVGYGNTTDLGWKAYAGISVLNSPLEIDRAYYNGAEKEWGYGKTRTRSLNYTVRGGYTFQPNAKYQVTPFTELSYGDSKWNGYSENGDGPFLATFGKQRSRVTSLRLGVNNLYQIDSKNSMGLAIDLRKNLHINNANAVASVMDGFGGLSTQYQIKRVNKVLPEMEAYYSHSVKANQNITVYSGYRDVGFGSGEVNGGVSYRISF